MLGGCAGLKETSKDSFKGVSSIIPKGEGVEFKAPRSVKMTMTKDADGKIEYTFDSQAPSLLSRILSAATLGAVGVRR